jgi:exodeoxyribonuclease-3
MTTILSWNVNGLRAAVKNGFLDWLDRSQPDILCLQETRALPEDLEETIRAPFGYQSWWNPAEKKGYSGTAVYSRTAPKSVATMGVPEFDAEGRLQVVEFPELTILNGYWPNSQAERARLDYKLAFCAALLDVANGLVKKKRNVLICGDFNIAHQPMDLARPKENENNAGYYIEEREAMTRLLDAGYADTFRSLHPEAVEYSWWSYRMNARPKNIGWRIDCMCVNRAFLPQVKAAWIAGDVTGSDHCPVGVEIGREASH